MSWLFSRALIQAYENSHSSPELAEEYLEATCSAGVPSAPLSVMPTPHKFWCNDKTMEPSQLSRFGLTCAVLTEDLGEALLTWFRADSRVRTYPLPGMESASMVSAQASGEKWHESSVRYDLDSSSWRTHRSLFEEDLPWSSVTLPSWGMTLAGVLWEPPISGRPISATASGLWPTPNACKASNDVTLLKSGDGRSKPNKLGWAVALSLKDKAIGQLNPEWVEWLMGWPLEWTDLKPLGMARFQEWLQQHSLISHLNGSEEAA